MNKYIEKIRLSGDTIKIIACFLMLIDHASFCLLNYYLNKYHMDILPQTFTKLNNIYEYGRGVGRIAFPIFCFFLVEGFFRTRDKAKYFSRLLVCAIVSEIPFDLATFKTVFYIDHQNTLFTLLIAFVMMLVLDYLNNKIPGLSTNVKVLASLCTVALFAEFSTFAKTDYSYKGIFLIAVLYFLHEMRPLQLIAGAAFSSWEKNGPVAFLLLYFWDPDKKPRLKYFFYFFYPLHLILIYLVSVLLFQ